ncbi:MAG: hypothetical protein FJZ56_00460 [Chlamydiae bacterium]|nr:hypothetical protein [Chlamydiota bacterium]
MGKKEKIKTKSPYTEEVKNRLLITQQENTRFLGTADHVANIASAIVIPLGLTNSHLQKMHSYSHSVKEHAQEKPLKNSPLAASIRKLENGVNKLKAEVLANKKLQSSVKERLAKELEKTFASLQEKAALLTSDLQKAKIDRLLQKCEALTSEAKNHSAENLKQKIKALETDLPFFATQCDSKVYKKFASLTKCLFTKTSGKLGKRHFSYRK